MHQQIVSDLEAVENNLQSVGSHAALLIMCKKKNVSVKIGW